MPTNASEMDLELMIFAYLGSRVRRLKNFLREWSALCTKKL